MKKGILWALAGLLAILIIVAIAKGGGGTKDKRVATEETTRRNILETVTANGKVQPEIEVIISADVSGEIINVATKEGAEVKVGELLVEINPDIYLSNRDKATATLNSMRANLANAKARMSRSAAGLYNDSIAFKRNEKLKNQGAVSDAEFDAAKAKYLSSSADFRAAKESVRAAMFNVENADAALKESEENLRRTNIYAPVNGTVYGLQKEKGERVAGTSQFSAGTEIFRIADLNNMEVNVEVNENDIVRVHMGDTAQIDVDAFVDRRFTGVVTEIANSANLQGNSVDQVTTFNVKIHILEDSYSDLMDTTHAGISPFRPGMSATVEINTARHNNVLAVPVQAVTVRPDTASEDYNKLKSGDDEAASVFDDEDMREVVFVFNNGKVIQHTVQTGIQDNTYIEILSGIEKGTEVVSAPYSLISKELENGDEVLKVDKDALYDYLNE